MQAPENWTFLKPLTDTQVLDFYHAPQYLDQAAKAVHSRSVEAQKIWMKEHCHTLKHEIGAAKRLLSEMEAILSSQLSATLRDGLQDTMTYFRNHHHQMHYAQALCAHLPIRGSPRQGVKSLSKPAYVRLG